MSQHYARLRIHPPGGVSLDRLLDPVRSYRIGRDEDCEMVVTHGSVSRLHAEIACDARTGKWTIRDCGSKNGTRVDGALVVEATLPDDGWMSVGDVFCEFNQLGSDDVVGIETEWQSRRRITRTLGDGLDRGVGIERLLDQVLQSMIDIAECQRGFLLTGTRSDALSLRRAVSIDPKTSPVDHFDGSSSAVEHCMLHHRPVLLSSPADRAWLRGRASVVRSGIRALACVPLLASGQLLGVVHLDSDDAERQFSELDVELLEAFAERAAAAISLAMIEARIGSLELNHSSDGTREMAR